MMAIGKSTKKRQQEKIALRVHRWSASDAIFSILGLSGFLNIQFNVDKFFSSQALETIYFTPPSEFFFDATTKNGKNCLISFRICDKSQYPNCNKLPNFIGDERSPPDHFMVANCLKK